MTLKEHRRARWRLRREIRRGVRDIAEAIRYRLDTSRLEALRGRAYRGGKSEADVYARYAMYYWRIWE